MRAWPLLLLIGLTCWLGLGATEPRGDCADYLLDAHALATHGTPEIRSSDAAWLADRDPAQRRLAENLVQGMHDRTLTPIGDVRRDDDGKYYAIHFWFYSLLAVPFLISAELFNAPPMLALGAVNAIAASAAMVALWDHFGRKGFGFVAALLFLAAGTTFYLRWTGPEVLTATTAVIACLRARRGDLGGALVAGAIASVQNASAAALLPFAFWSWWPQRTRLSPTQLKLCAAAILLACLPYAFYYAHYSIPSITGRFATNPKLIGGERAWSFVFDLNQGLLLGLPGILVGTLAGPVIAFRNGTPWRTVLSVTASTLLLVAAMAIPTLGVHNWNMGESVIIRYGYWAAVPLCLLVLQLAVGLPARTRTAFLAGVGGLQLAAMAPYGVLGERYSYLRHTWAAAAVLRYFPSAYNPRPEIFYERTLGREANAADVIIAPWPPQTHPYKILRDAARPPLDERICPHGGLVTSDHVHDMGEDWLYLDPPFRCTAAVPAASSAGTGTEVAPSGSVKTAKKP